MAAPKRKIPDGSLQRRVRPRVEEEPGSDAEWSSDRPSEEGLESQESEGGEDASSDDDDAEDQSNASSEEDPAEAIDASQLSFGALARAQASFSSPRSKTPSQKGRLKDDDQAAMVTKVPKANIIKPAKRTSKHAPQEMSSKRPVSRKREVIAVPKVQARDPRFGPLGAPASGMDKLDELKAQKAYAFLEDYREDEMRQLRGAIKKTKDVAQKEELQRALMSMQSRKKDRQRREREQAVMDEHRRKEKELVKQGKKPFYLKKSEQKKRVLVDKFAGMRKGQVDKAIERKRKKIVAKERREMPMVRRGFEEQ